MSNESSYEALTTPAITLIASIEHNISRNPTFLHKDTFLVLADKVYIILL